MAELMRLESVEFAMIWGGDDEGWRRDGLWRGDKMPYQFNCRNCSYISMNIYGRKLVMHVARGFDGDVFSGLLGVAATLTALLIVVSR